MSNIKTAKEVIKEQFGVSIHSNNSAPMDKGECIVCMIEFAKMHVELALTKANEEAIAIIISDDFVDAEVEIDEDSILNSYPLENIK